MRSTRVSYDVCINQGWEHYQVRVLELFTWVDLDSLLLEHEAKLADMASTAFHAGTFKAWLNAFLNILDCQLCDCSNDCREA